MCGNCKIAYGIDVSTCGGNMSIAADHYGALRKLVDRPNELAAMLRRFMQQDADKQRYADEQRARRSE